MADTVYEVRLNELHKFQVAAKNSRAKRKILRAGRRGGKTVYASDESVDSFLDGKRVLYAVPTGDQLQKWWFEVCRALQPLIDAKIVIKNESNKSITRPGTENRIRGKTAWDAQTLRGDYADVLILDELQNMSEDTWDEVGAPMLLDNDGDAIFIFTPPSIQSRSRSKAKNKMWVIDFWRKHSKDTTGRWETFAFTSFDNPFISRVALDEIVKDMTSLAYRQEIMAEAIDQAPGALWSRDELEKHRCALADRPQQFTRIGVAVDPSLTKGGDDAGIIAGGIDALFGHYYVLQDSSINGTPLEWAKKAILLYFELEADYIIFEKNAGGEEMIRLTVENAASQLFDEERIPTVDIRLVFVNASRGKQVRADPVSAMYERGIVHHVGNLPDLEDELCLWSPTDTKSPNRLDAVVWLMTMLKSAGAPSEEQMRAYANAEEMRKVDQTRMQVLPGTHPPAIEKDPDEKLDPELADIQAYLNVGVKKNGA